MTMLDNTIEDVAGRFGLGPKSGPLMHEVTQLITGSPGGIGGFIDKFKSAGLGSEAASWLGRTDGAALTASRSRKRSAARVLGGIASRLGLAGGVVGTAIGYLLPKLIGQMTPGGVIPSEHPGLSLRLHDAGAQTDDNDAASGASGPSRHERDPRYSAPGAMADPAARRTGRARALLVSAVRQSAGTGRGYIHPGSRRAGAAASADTVGTGSARAQQ